MARQQQALIEVSLERFQRTLNEALLDGWQIVPGSFAAQSMQLVAGDRCPVDLRLPDGTTFSRTFFCVLEQVPEPVGG